MIHSQAVGGDANRSWENPDVEGTAHIRVLPFCLLKFIYTPGFEKIYCVELCDLKPTGQCLFMILPVSHDDARGEADHTADG